MYRAGEYSWTVSNDTDAQKDYIWGWCYTSLGNDEVCGIIDLIRISNVKGLGILEQARLITELKQVHHMGNAEIALMLEKSKSWVSMRSGIVGDMTPMSGNRYSVVGFQLMPSCTRCAGSCV